MNDASEHPQPGRRLRPLLVLVLLALVALVAWQPAVRQDIGQSLQAVVTQLPIAPRTWYTLRLHIAGIADTPVGKQWQTAVARAARQPTRVTSAYRTQSSFDTSTPTAHVYALTLERGQHMKWRLKRTDTNQGRLFASLENRQDDGEWHTVIRLEADGRSHRESIDRDGDYRLVLQPALGADPRYRLAMASGGSLPFPVADGGLHDIKSVFGDPRDNGRRTHHGVDIFADRGTLVQAVASGRVRTGNSGIGGKHVWLADGMLGIGGVRYYYAHLDTIAVDSNDRVTPGDVLGTVGNTGNAKTTPPHLHFAIYTAAGPLDPAPFIQPPPRLPDPP